MQFDRKDENYVYGFIGKNREFDSFKLIKSYKPLKNGYFFVNF